MSANNRDAQRAGSECHVLAAARHNMLLRGRPARAFNCTWPRGCESRAHSLTRTGACSPFASCSVVSVKRRVIQTEAGFALSGS